MHRKFIAFIIGSAMTVTSLSATAVKASDHRHTAARIAGATALAAGVTLVGGHKHHGHVSRGQGHHSRHYAPRRHRGYYAPRYRSHRGYSYRSHRSYGYRPYRSHGYRSYGYRHRGYNSHHRYGYGR